MNEYEIKSLILKKSDVLVVKYNGMLKETDRQEIAEGIEKIVECKVLVIDNRLDLSILEVDTPHIVA